ncbi:hypothetical protein FQN54_007839 [Arachnomyces sp. PD_36]|nr:hypothetical protein FQN54_007839 [Arachnomyces sp. PD_36]
MTEVDQKPQFGAELKDAFKPVNAWVSNGIGWLDEVQQFYRERSVIEKEYASKLSALCKKYHDRKAKKSSSLSVGDTPTMTPGSLGSASLTTWTTQLSTVEAYAAERDRFGADLVFQVAEPLKQLATRFEDLRKSHAEYAVKLEKERDASYGDLKKTKGKYDGMCQEVENRRKKTESSFDHGKQKAQNAYQQQVLEMNNVKNTYLININVTNKLKEKYYHEYMPELLDGLQELSETRVSKLNHLWSFATQLETATITRSSEHLAHLASEIPRNDPTLDSMMFLRHNVVHWQEPKDMEFEPSPVWHDDASMVTDEMAKIFLRNILSKSKGHAKELKADADKKRKEVQTAKRIRQSVREGKDKRDEVEIVRAIFGLQEGLHLLVRKQLTAEVEASTITSVVGDLSLGAKNHNFKSQTFKIPTNCDLCGERIWGLSAKGFDCSDCGYVCHSKCQMKVPAECPGELSKDEKKKLKAERQESASTAPSYDPNANPSSPAVSEMPSLSRKDTMNSLSSGYATNRSVSMLASTPTTEETTAELPASAPAAKKPAPARKNRIAAPPPTQYVSAPPSELEGSKLSLPPRSNESRGKMLYPYQENGEGEITVDEGKDVVILEPDDGSGWIRVRAGALDGLVPAAYVESTPASPALPERPGSTISASSTSQAGSLAAAAKRKGPAVAPKRGAKKVQYVEALYDYEARSDAEFSMAEGDRFVLINRDSGDGWADVEQGGQTKSVPANYIQEVS